MTKENSVTFEELNYFIDGQLTRSERVKVLDDLKKDNELSRSLCELQRNDEFVLLSYSHIPEPEKDPFLAATKQGGRKLFAIAAMLLILISSTLSWKINSYLKNDQQPNIMELSQLGENLPKSNKVLIHVSEMDDVRINRVLETTEKLLAKNTQVHIEIVASTGGLSMLRKNSPYAARISTLSRQHPNVKFKACGIAMHMAQLSEGKKILLLPEAEKVPAALDEILNLLKDNWAYIKA
jgi:intracellular sulfur oxidation DsrE/DsrF family protein